MKLRLLRLLCLLMAMSLFLPCVLAEGAEDQEENKLLQNLSNTPDSLLVLGDALYAQEWSYLYKAVEGGWQPIEIDRNGIGNIQCVAAGKDGLYLLGQRSETWNEVTESWEMPEGTMFSVSFMPVDESGDLGKRELLCDITWDVNEDNWPQFYGMQIVDGTAYFLLHDDDVNWDLHALYRVDLTTGKGTKVMEDYISQLVLYKDGLLLGRRFNWDEAYDYQTGKYLKTPEIVSIDPATGEVTVLGFMPDTNCGALAYDAETDMVYYAGASFVYRYDSTFASAETVGYLIGGNSSRNNSASVLYRDRFYVSDWNDESRLASATVDPSLLPTRTLRLASVWTVNDVVREYAKEHPEVAIEYIETTVSTAEDYRSHMQSPEAADIYNLVLPYRPYAPLLKYGLLADMSSSETLMNVVGSMYPNLTDEFLMDGKLYGLPVYVYGGTMGYYPDALEKVGMTEEDLPTTYDELIDFLVTWYYDYYDDYEDMKIFEWASDLRSVMFNLIFNAQVLTCEARGEALTFRTPTLQKLLNRLDSPEMKTVFDALGPKEDPNGNQLTAYVYVDGDESTAIFDNYADPMPKQYQQWMAPQPILLQLDEDTEPVIQASVYLLSINKASANQDLALDLMEYIAEHLPQDVRTAFMPDVREPIEEEYYQENLSYYQQELEQIEKQMEDLTDEERADYDDILSWYKERVRKMQEEERWAFSEEDVAFYHESIAPHLVVSASSIFTGDDNPATTAIQLYLEGARDANWFVSEIDRVVNMMQLENQ